MIPGVARLRQHPTPDPPEEIGVRDGLTYALFVPESPRGGVVVLHGAGSTKESHYDFARAARFMGLSAVSFDQRGHGESEGALDDRAAEDVAAMAGLLGPLPIALRGSSMGGYMAIVAARDVGASAVVAICPAGAEHLLRGLDAGAFPFRADEPRLRAFLEANDPMRAVAELDVPLLLLHAEGDEQIPVAHSVELHAAARSPRKRFLALPGGHHRSIQHDSELQGESLRFIARAVRAAGG
jgi:pimeloyl-ACP methyl ester carboxylesterase